MKNELNRLMELKDSLAEIVEITNVLLEPGLQSILYANISTRALSLAEAINTAAMYMNLSKEEKAKLK